MRMLAIQLKQYFLYSGIKKHENSLQIKPRLIGVTNRRTQWKIYRRTIIKTVLKIIILFDFIIHL